MLSQTVSVFSNVVNRIDNPLHPSTVGPSILSALWKRLFLRPSMHARTHALTRLFMLFSYHFNNPFHMCFYWW